MACKCSVNCNVIFGILSCNLPEDTIDVDLKVHTLWGIHTYKKKRSTQAIKCSPWGTEVKPFLSLQKKMAEFLRCRQITTTPFANSSLRSRPKATAARRCSLVTLTRPNKEKLSQSRKVNVGPLPKATLRNWLPMLKAKEWQVPYPARPPHLASQWKHQSLSSLLFPCLLSILNTMQSANHWGRYVLTKSYVFRLGWRPQGRR